MSYLLIRLSVDEALIGLRVDEALIRLSVDEAGEVAISYGLIAALVSVAAVLAMTQLGDTLPHVFGFVTNTMIDALSRMGLI